MTEVPHIGPAGAEKLRAAGVTTTFALFGKFLSLKDDGVGSVELCDRFFYWLESINLPPGSRSSVVEAVASKLDLSFPGIYEADRYK